MMKKNDNLKDKKELKVLIADVVPPNITPKEMSERLEELKNLTSTYEGIVIIDTIQKRSKPDYNTYIGKGKLEEIKNIMQEKKIDLLILGNILKPHQTFNIEESLREIGASVWDRIDLILKIFERNASSTEARLQIELASIKHMGPRIFGMGMELSRQGGGIGTRGKGETNTQKMKKHLRDREKQIKNKLKEYEKVRYQHRESRLKKDLSTVGIVGYTNAGKSSLMNALTSKGVLQENKLFATLGTSVGKMYKDGKEVLLSDTIGFIRDLPPSLIDAFSSTLEDSIESQLLLHVVDSNDSNIQNKINVVDEILENINASQDKIYVFNKIDKISQEKLDILKSKYKDYNPIFVSSVEGIGIENLKHKIINNIN